MLRRNFRPAHLIACRAHSDQTGSWSIRWDDGTAIRRRSSSRARPRASPDGSADARSEGSAMIGQEFQRTTNIPIRAAPGQDHGGRTPK